MDSLLSKRKRLRLQSHRRGMRELDLILGAFADRFLEGMHEGELERFDAFLQCTEQELYLVLVECRNDLEMYKTFNDLIDHIRATTLHQG